MPNEFSIGNEFRRIHSPQVRFPNLDHLICGQFSSRLYIGSTGSDIACQVMIFLIASQGRTQDFRRGGAERGGGAEIRQRS